VDNTDGVRILRRLGEPDCLGFVLGRLGEWGLPMTDTIALRPRPPFTRPWRCPVCGGDPKVEIQNAKSLAFAMRRPFDAGVWVAERLNHVKVEALPDGDEEGPASEGQA
jgi:hypothetical protein